MQSPAAASVIQIGTPDNGNCYPYACNDSGTSTGQSIDYQQVYSSTLFPHATTIISATGFYDQATGGSQFILGGEYAVYWGYAAHNAVNNLSNTLAGNYIAPPTFLYQALVTTGTDSFDPSGILPLGINYDPTQGDLIIEIIASNQDNVPNGSGNGYYEADDTGTVTKPRLLHNGPGLCRRLHWPYRFVSDNKYSHAGACHTGARRRRTIGSWTSTASCKSLIGYRRCGNDGLPGRRFCLWAEYVRPEAKGNSRDPVYP